MKKMRAAFINRPQSIAIIDVALPEPTEGEVRLRVDGCGVCGSNLGPWKGLPWLEYPMAPGEGGHEAWGVIDAVGPGVERWRSGQEVAALSYRSFAEYDLVSSEHLVALPKSLAGRPIPAEPIGCAFNVISRSDVQPGMRVAVVGIGFMGALLVALAKRAGAHVVALSRRRRALEAAEQMGADAVVPMEDYYEALPKARDLSGGALYDRVIEVTGIEWPLSLAAELTRERGKLIIAGYHQDGARQVNMQLWNWRGLDVINAHERDPRTCIEGMRAAVDAAASGQLDLDALITHQLPLDELGEAMRLTSERPAGFLKAVVKP